MTDDAARASRSSRSGRATACRTRAVVGSDRRQDRVRRLPQRAGLPVIEVAAFVSPKWVPQMADAAEVFAGIARAARRPLHRARAESRRASSARIAAGVTEVAIFAAASETFSQQQHQPDRSTSRSTSTARCATRAAARGHARARLPLDGVRLSVRGRRRRRRASPTVAARSVELGAFEVAVSDTIGVAHPGQVRAVVERRRRARARSTRGAALSRHARHGAGQRPRGARPGHRDLRRSAGGLGGCPYAPGASGNLATEDLIYMLDGLGIETGVDLERLVVAASAVHRIADRTLAALALLPRRGGQAVNRESAGRAIHDSRHGSTGRDGYAQRDGQETPA